MVTSTGCKSTRLLADDEYLLNKNTVNIDVDNIEKKELVGYYRQKPNSRFMFTIKIKLAVYNYAKSGKPRKIKNWLGRVAGEPPVVYDETLAEKTKQQFERYMRNKAYYNAQVNHNVVYYKKKAFVNYKITAGQPLIVNKVTYQVDDSNLVNLVLADTNMSPVKAGRPFELEFLNTERQRITKKLQNNGYYKFTSDYIKFNVDSANYKADITIVVSQQFQAGFGTQVVQKAHSQYYINNVYFYPNYNPQAVIRNRNQYQLTYDTTYYRNFYFIYSGSQNIKPKTILKAGDLKPGQMYSIDRVNSSNRYLNSLRIFRLNNTYFEQSAIADTLLDCHIQLTPFTYQNFSVNFETTNTKGNLGLGGAFNYQHKNAFKGAEIFNFKVSGSTQFVRAATDSLSSFTIIEFGAEAALNIPSFVLPIKLDRFYKRYNPKTAFLAAVNYQQRPDYTRIIYSASMGYYWNSQQYILHNIIPIDLSSVKVSGSQSFLDGIKGSYLENNYRDYFIAGGRYSFIINKIDDRPLKRSYYLRYSLDIAGNMLNTAYNLFNNADTVEGGYFEIFGLAYAQYIKNDIDYRYYINFTKGKQLVFRGFGGIAVPYGNSNGVPFIKQYYSGGAEGLRAWTARGLGPGIYRQLENTYPNQSADIKLEFNAEYRFNITESFKGATFIDVSNIWTLTDDKNRPGANFELNRFYKDFAVGSGFGLRYDVKFAVIRVDAGIKVRDPSFVGNSTWILFERKPSVKHIVWNFAIGYPF